MSPRRQILKLKLAAMLGLKASFDADYSVRKRSTSVDSHLHKLAMGSSNLATCATYAAALPAAQTGSLSRRPV